jgi:hypothetical protein
MKKLIVLLLVPLFSFSQELSLNPDTKVYEYSEVKDLTISSGQLFKNFEDKMIELNYTNVMKTDNKIIGNNFVSFLILMTTVQVNFQTIIEVKDNKYRLLINKFIVDDKRYSPIPIEDLKKYTKRWVTEINKKLPTIVSAIESPITKW